MNYSRVGNFWSRNYTEYESKRDRNETLPTEEYLNKSRPCWKAIINGLRKSDKWENQLTAAINFFSFKGNDEEHVMCSKSDNI